MKISLYLGLKSLSCYNLNSVFSKNITSNKFKNLVLKYLLFDITELGDLLLKLELRNYP